MAVSEIGLRDISINHSVARRPYSPLRTESERARERQTSNETPGQWNIPPPPPPPSQPPLRRAITTVYTDIPSRGGLQLSLEVLVPNSLFSIDIWAKRSINCLHQRPLLFTFLGFADPAERLGEVTRQYQTSVIFPSLVLPPYSRRTEVVEYGAAILPLEVSATLLRVVSCYELLKNPKCCKGNHFFSPSWQIVNQLPL